MSDDPSPGSDPGTGSSWWPSESGAGAGLVEVQASSGERVCGELAEAPAGQLRIIADGSPVSVGLHAVSSLRSVDSC